jgi:hypothetical protein
VLHARAAVELEVLVDLALALAGRRLVDRELDGVASSDITMLISALYSVEMSLSSKLM